MRSKPDPPHSELQISTMFTTLFKLIFCPRRLHIDDLKAIAWRACNDVNPSLLDIVLHDAPRGVVDDANVRLVIIESKVGRCEDAANQVIDIIARMFEIDLDLALRWAIDVGKFIIADHLVERGAVVRSYSPKWGVIQDWTNKTRLEWLKKHGYSLSANKSEFLLGYLCAGLSLVSERAMNDASIKTLVAYGAKTSDIVDGDFGDNVFLDAMIKKATC